MSALAHLTPAPPPIPAGLLEALIDPTRTLPAIARDHGLSVADLLRIMAGPDFRQELDLAYKAITERTRLLGSLALPKAVEALSRLIHQVELDVAERSAARQHRGEPRPPTPTPTPTPTHANARASAHANECLRKCVALLARLANLSSPSRRSVAPGRTGLPPVRSGSWSQPSRTAEPAPAAARRRCPRHDAPPCPHAFPTHSHALRPQHAIPLHAPDPLAPRSSHSGVTSIPRLAAAPDRPHVAPRPAVNHARPRRRSLDGPGRPRAVTPKTCVRAHSRTLRHEIRANGVDLAPNPFTSSGQSFMMNCPERGSSARHRRAASLFPGMRRPAAHATDTG